MLQNVCEGNLFFPQKIKNPKNGCLMPEPTYTVRKKKEIVSKNKL